MIATYTVQLHAFIAYNLRFMFMVQMTFIMRAIFRSIDIIVRSNANDFLFFALERAKLSNL